MASRIPVLPRLFGQCGDDLFPRFAASYEELRALPRRTRRALQRRLAGCRELTAVTASRVSLPGGRTLRHQLAWSLAGAAFLLALGPTAEAATITVNTTKPGLLPGDGKCSLIEAITAANTDTDVDACVRAGGGTGADTIGLPKKSNHILTQVNNGENGLPLITTPITIEGNGATISRKKGPTQFRLFEIAGGSLTLNAVKLTGGSSPLGGGAVFNNGGTLTVTNSRITGNVAAGGGGGVLSNDGNVTVQNSIISNNKASYGGGVYHFHGAFTVENSQITTNTATQFGGGIQNGLDSTFTLTGSTVSGNKAVNTGDEGIGGGISNDGTLAVENSQIKSNVANSPIHGGYGGGIANYGTATVSSSLISGNTASAAKDDAAGGGIQNCGDLTVLNSHITKNTAKTTSSDDYSFGGGLSNGGGPTFCRGTASVSQSTMSLNKAEFGAGVYNYYGTVALENSTISGNTATFWGGGLFNYGAMTLSNVTITKNNAKYGAGIYNAGTYDNETATVTLNRTLISGNKAPSGAGPEVYNNPDGLVNVDAFNLFGQKNNPGVVNVTPGASDVIPGLTVTTPKILSPTLKNNGGPTPTHALVAGSPALDQIDTGAPGTDQRGVTRPQGALSDIGAFEREVAP
jgi:hypothetical protein